MRYRVALIIFGFSMLLLAGCGQQSMAPVSGQVTWNGKPVKHATVIFSPVPQSEDDKEPGKPAMGTSDENGRYVLSTHKLEDGALVGPHRVTIAVDDANPARCQRMTKMTLDVKPGANELNIELK